MNDKLCSQRTLPQPVTLLFVGVLLIVVTAAKEKRSVNELLGKIENFCNGDEICSGDLTDDLINYLYDGQPVGNGFIRTRNVQIIKKLLYTNLFYSWTLDKIWGQNEALCNRGPNCV